MYSHIRIVEFTISMYVRFLRCKPQDVRVSVCVRVWFCFCPLWALMCSAGLLQT